jgi:hypothetical protein
MLIGIIVGTYSSLFIATPVLVDTISREDKKLIEKNKSRKLVVLYIIKRPNVVGSFFFDFKLVLHDSI